MISGFLFARVQLFKVMRPLSRIINKRYHGADQCKALLYFGLAISTLAVLSCSGSRSHVSSGEASAQENNYKPSPYAAPLEKDDYQWARPAKDYASLRYSSLDQINVSNVKDLKVAFTFSTGMDRGHEAAPLVVDETTDESSVANCEGFGFAEAEGAGDGEVAAIGDGSGDSGAVPFD